MKVKIYDPPNQIYAEISHKRFMRFRKRGLSDFDILKIYKLKGQIFPMSQFEILFFSNFLNEIKAEIWLHIHYPYTVEEVIEGKKSV